MDSESPDAGVPRPPLSGDTSAELDAVNAFLMLVAMNSLPPVSLPLVPLVTAGTMDQLTTHDWSDSSSENNRTEEADMHTSVIKPTPVYASAIVCESPTFENRPRVWNEQPGTSATTISTSRARAFKPFAETPDDNNDVDVDGDTEMELESASGTDSHNVDLRSSSNMMNPSVRRGRPTRARLQEVKLKKCRRALQEIAKHTDEHTNACPYCVDSLKFSPNQLVMHLIRHAGRPYYPYQCPKPHCEFTAIDSSHAKAHFVNVHQGRWTGRIEALADHTENQARIKEWREMFVKYRKQRREKFSSA
ncbi:hypothetical protein AAVH_05636 [Aphelenchoides avenae]|nr:hypothetical protein AAVH_05636 [Aphelenchus avenae]